MTFIYCSNVYFFLPNNILWLSFLVSTHKITSHCLAAAEYFIVGVYNNVFKQSLANGHLGCFQFFTITSNVLVLINKQRKPFVLSFAGHMHAILMAGVASEPLKGQDPMGTVRSRAGWADRNHGHLCGCISAF